MGIERDEEALGFCVQHDLDLVRGLFVKQQTDLLADQSGRSFEGTTIDGDAAVLVDPAADLLAEVIVQIDRRFANQFQVRGEALQGRLVGGGMGTAVIGLLDPIFQRLVEVFECFSGKI